MLINFNSRLLVLAFVFLTMVVTGCATSGPRKSPETIAAPPAEIASSTGWWAARFRLNWPQEEEALWHLDLLIAHKIIKPVLEQYNDQILLWRFHRRAARDQAGHQFSFIFYASAERAHQIYDAIRSNALLLEMKSAGIINKDYYDHPAKITKPRIEDTSDHNWPPPIQKTWPYYIMGVCQMWLNLISQIVADMPTPEASSLLQENEKLYKAVNIAITALWEKNGRHAFMHHLNAIFGYQPVIYYEKRMLRF